MECRIWTLLKNAKAWGRWPRKCLNRPMSVAMLSAPKNLNCDWRFSRDNGAGVPLTHHRRCADSIRTALAIAVLASLITWLSSKIILQKPNLAKGGT